ncbi:unnamed protein product [Coregonus sp. 'balchen']|nr:unnamed protein product [Coregonus sp. 'balchen']
MNARRAIEEIKQTAHPVPAVSGPTEHDPEIMDLGNDTSRRRVTAGCRERHPCAKKDANDLAYLAKLELDNREEKSEPSETRYSEDGAPKIKKRAQVTRSRRHDFANPGSGSARLAGTSVHS